MDWTTFASLATAAGTMLLAAATFVSVRSANRSARVAEEAMLAGVRPLVVSSRLDDPAQKVLFREGHALHVPGGNAMVEVTEDVIFLAISVRNVSQGIAVLDSWWLSPTQVEGTTGHADPEAFVRLTRDLYLPAGDIGFWQGALRDPSSAQFRSTRAVAREHGPMTVELLYGDHLGGQHAIVRFALRPVGEDRWLATVVRHWNLDRANPR